MEPFEHLGKLGMTSRTETQARRQQLKDAGVDITYAELKKVLEVEANSEVYINDIYTVTVQDAVQAEMVLAGTDTGWPAMWYLSIKRTDREVIWDWRELQEIKNLICGEANEGFQLFPAQDRVVDTANQYHLFVLKEAKLCIPVGFPAGVVTDNPVPNTKQRTLEKEISDD